MTVAEEICRLDGGRLFVPENATEAQSLVEWLYKEGAWNEDNQDMVQFDIN